MTFEILVVLSLLVVALILFWLERVPFDVAALIVMIALMLFGILTPRQALSGFANEATITIACMFALSEGIRRTGALSAVAEWFVRAGERGFWSGAAAMMATVAVLSAFINNTAAVAIFIPVTLQVSARLGVSPTKLLMPLSFAAMLGGVCTLIGTSTNLLVSSIAAEHGQRPFSMFEFAPLGLAATAIGFAYLLLVGIRWLPARRPATDLTDRFQLTEYLTDLRIEPGWEHVGKRLAETPLERDHDIDVLKVFREAGDGTVVAEPDTRLQAGDILRVRGGAEEIRSLMTQGDLCVRPAREWHDVDLQIDDDSTLIEAVIAPEANLAEAKVGSARLRERFGAVVLAVRHRGRSEHVRLDEVRLAGGDSLLLLADNDRLPSLQTDPSFVIVSRLELPDRRERKMPLAVAILAAVVAAPAIGLTSIVVSALCGVGTLVLTGCLTTEEVYRSIHWKVILLLAGLLPLGLAMDTTGASELISSRGVELLGPYGPAIALAGFLALSMLLTNLISNQATAVLLAPVAIQSAESLQADPRPFLVAVTVAASLSFMSPVSYQTNTLVYDPGHYKFSDFVRVGTPLNVVLWVVISLLIPVLWPF